MEKKAMKSIRQDILAVLNLHGEQTIDDLMLRLPDYEQKQIASNLQPARADGQVASRRDDVTGKPAYRITEAGKERLAELKASSARVAEAIESAEVAAASAKVAKTRVDIPGAESHVIVKAPPILDATLVISNLQNELRVQTERGDMLGKSIVSFCEWLAGAADSRVPMSLHEAKAVINGMQEKQAQSVKATKPQQPRRPFSVTGLNGYHAGGEKVTLFLDRRLNARSITLEAEKLQVLADMARRAA